MSTASLYDLLSHPALKPGASPEDLASWHEVMMDLGHSYVLGFEPGEVGTGHLGIALATLDQIATQQVSLSVLASTILSELLNAH